MTTRDRAIEIMTKVVEGRVPLVPAPINDGSKPRVRRIEPEVQELIDFLQAKQNGVGLA